MTETKTKRQPTFFESLLPLICVALFLGIGYGIFKLKAEFLLIAAAFVSGLIALRLGYTWQELEQGIVLSISKGMPAMLIVICVGLLIGSWIACGTIPMLVYFGLKIISPQFFLVTACIVCSVVSLFTGTSWGTVGTMGVAFMGIAQPFSDTTNLAPIAAKSNLFDHIKHMLWTTTPAWLIGLFVYFFVGRSYATRSFEADQMTVILETIRTYFHFHWLLLLPPVLILYFAIRKKPTIPGMIVTSLLATILGIIIQKVSLNKLVIAMTLGYKSTTGVEIVDKLFTRGGMAGMMHVTLIAFCAFSFAGIVQKASMLDVLLDRLLKVAKSTGALIASTVASGVAVALMTGSSFLTILIPGELFAPAYKARGLAAKNLSRTTEDSGTVVVPLVPWSMAGVFMAGTLDVPTLTYLPWAVMCYLGMVFALIYGYTGFAIAPKIRDDETIVGS